MPSRSNASIISVIAILISSIFLKFGTSFPNLTSLRFNCKLRMMSTDAGKLSKEKSQFFENILSWEKIDNHLTSVETISERSAVTLAELGRGDSNHRADLRLFDAPENFIPEVILYRDTAGWCPYCEKVWFYLEEKRIPYKVIKVPMRCYGEKPRSFLSINPSGGIPVANIRGSIITESK